jgi:hypothetical protein
VSAALSVEKSSIVQVRVSQLGLAFSSSCHDRFGKEAILAKTNYSFEKRRRELAKKKKKEEKEQRKAERGKPAAEDEASSLQGPRSGEDMTGDDSEGR